jgi:hypothetical protein
MMAYVKPKLAAFINIFNFFIVYDCITVKYVLDLHSPTASNLKCFSLLEKYGREYSGMPKESTTLNS